MDHKKWKKGWVTYRNGVERGMGDIERILGRRNFVVKVGTF